MSMNIFPLEVFDFGVSRYSIVYKDPSSVAFAMHLKISILKRSDQQSRCCLVLCIVILNFKIRPLKANCICKRPIWNMMDFRVY